MDAGPLKVHLAGGIPGFLRLFEGLQSLVVFVAIRERPAQVKARQRPLGLFEVLDRFPRWPKKNNAMPSFKCQRLAAGPVADSVFFSRISVTSRSERYCVPPWANALRICCTVPASQSSRSTRSALRSIIGTPNGHPPFAEGGERFAREPLAICLVIAERAANR